MRPMRDLDASTGAPGRLAGASQRSHALRVIDVSMSYQTPEGPLQALSEIAFDVAPAEFIWSCPE